MSGSLGLLAPWGFLATTQSLLLGVNQRAMTSSVAILAQVIFHSIFFMQIRYEGSLVNNFGCDSGGLRGDRVLLCAFGSVPQAEAAQEVLLILLL